MRFLLRSDGFVDAAELVLNAVDLMPRGFALLVIQLCGSGARQPTIRAVRDGSHHFQIAYQFGAGPSRSFFLCLSLRFEKQLGIIQNAFADRGRTFAPRGIQLAGFTGIAVMLGEDCGHPLAILQALACHRHQKLQRHLRQDFALAHLLLDRLRQNFHQRQPPRYPAHTAIEPARQLIEPVAEALLQLGQQPTHLQRGLVFRQAQRTVQQHGRRLAHRPHHCFHRVPAQLLQRRDPLIAVDDYVTVCQSIRRYDYDGCLLPTVGQRCQQPPLPRRVAHSQVLPASIELVKLQLHQTG
jgi:hypothetical protein